MKTLVVGGTGTTGQHLVLQLLERGHHVTVIVRSPEKLPPSVRDHDNAHVVKGTVLDLSEPELAMHVRGCDAIASCLGHTLNFHGMFGSPRRLVTDSLRRLCRAAEQCAPAQPVRFVLMNSSGCRDTDIPESVSLPERAVLLLLHTLLPPHADNEQAAAYLRGEIGQGHRAVEWVIVRPDALVNEEAVTPYELHPSPIRSAIFDSGKTSRINTADCMAELMVTPAYWSRWAGRSPVVYNASHA